MEQNQTSLPQEIVEVYRQPDYREVVETYSYALPAKKRKQSQWALPVKTKKKRRGLRIFLIFLLAVLAVMAVGAGIGRLLDIRAEFNFFEEEFNQLREEEPTEITIPTYVPEETVALEVVTEHGDVLTAQEIYRRVNPAVVTVTVNVGDGMSMGTGVFFREDGYLLTNHHVVAGGSGCTVVLSTGHSYEAQYVAGDETQDLAILKIDATVPAAEFADSELLTVGDPVYAIGNPLGYEFRGTLTDGIVSAINRDVEVNGTTMSLIQTNAALNTGNSGGPLINQYGQVVGINVIKMDSTYSTVEGLGFAIPSASMKRLVNDLLIYGEIQPEPKLGIMVMSIGTQLAEDLWGAEVDSVTEGSAADKAGVQKGDFIIEAGGLTVIDSSDVLRARRQYRVGDEMPMKLWRDGEIVEVTLQLTEAAAAE